MKLVYLLTTFALVFGFIWGWSINDAFGAHEFGEPSHLEYPLGYDHLRAWYDDRQQYQIYGPAPLVWYHGFSMSFPTETNCGWTEVTGQVPYAGLVAVRVYEMELKIQENGQKYYETTELEELEQNINSNPANLLRGYVDLPCKFIPTKYLVALSWSRLPIEIQGLDTISFIREYTAIFVNVIG